MGDSLFFHDISKPLPLDLDIEAGDVIVVHFMESGEPSTSATVVYWSKGTMTLRPAALRAARYRSSASIRIRSANAIWSRACCSRCLPSAASRSWSNCVRSVTDARKTAGREATVCWGKAVVAGGANVKAFW